MPSMLAVATMGTNRSIACPGSAWLSRCGRFAACPKASGAFAVGEDGDGTIRAPVSAGYADGPALHPGMSYHFARVRMAAYTQGEDKGQVIKPEHQPGDDRLRVTVAPPRRM